MAISRKALHIWRTHSFAYRGEETTLLISVVYVKIATTDRLSDCKSELTLVA